MPKAKLQWSSTEEVAWLRARVSAYNSHPKYSVVRRVWVTETTQKLIDAFPANKATDFPVVLQVRPLCPSHFIYN